MKLLILASTTLSLAASAQTFTFGVQGGVPAQPPLRHMDKMPFTIGPTVDIRLFSGLSLQTGVLYHRIGQASENDAFLFPQNAVTLGFETRRGSAWELPILAKYRFLSERRGWQPFLLAGPSVRRTSVTSTRASYVVSGISSSTTTLPTLNPKSTQWNVDPSVGAGVDLGKGRVHIEPEVRYSYWGAGESGTVRKNQLSFLLGIRF